MTIPELQLPGVERRLPGFLRPFSVWQRFLSGFGASRWRKLVQGGAWLLLFLGLALSAAAFIYLNRQFEHEARMKFEAECETVERIIVTRLASYSDLLIGLGSFMRHAQRITRAEFHDYVEQLNLAKNNAGVTAVNFARQVEAAEKAAFVQSVRRDASVDAGGYPNFAIRQRAERASYHVVTFVEPLAANAGLLGIDLQTYTPGAEDAFAALRDSGEIITGPEVIAGSGDYQWSLRLATYRFGLPAGTPEQRGRALTGSVGLRFSLSQLMEEAFPAGDANRVRVRLHSFPRSHGAEPAFAPSEQNLIIDSFAPRPPGTHGAPANVRGGERFRMATPLNFGGRVLAVAFSGNPRDFATAEERSVPYVAAALGVALTLLLSALMRSLLRSRRDLESAVLERTAELNSANVRLLAERTQRIALERATLNIAEEERSRLGRELHDDLGQILSATACMAQSLSLDLESRWPPGAALANTLEGHLSGAVEKTRLLAQGLLPLASQVGSLSVALEQLAQHARESYRIGVRVACDPAQILEDRRAAQELYRVAQEAVLNAVRHGHATSVSIEFSISEAGARPRLVIIDNGSGIDAARAPAQTGVGVRIMRQRCHSIGLELTLAPNPGGGTMVRVE